MMTGVCLIFLAVALVRMRVAATWHGYYRAVDLWLNTVACLGPAVLMDVFVSLCLLGASR